jgi:hypothetical protein
LECLLFAIAIAALAALFVALAADFIRERFNGGFSAWAMFAD